MPNNYSDQGTPYYKDAKYVKPQHYDFPLPSNKATYPSYMIPDDFDVYALTELANIDGASYAHISADSYNWILPIPSQLDYGSNYSWSEEDLGHIGDFTANMFNFINDSDTGTKFGNMLKEVGVNAGMSKLLGDKATQKIFKDNQRAYNPNKTLFFNEVNMRDFSVSFSLAPLSMDEAEIIKKGFSAMAYRAAPGYSSDKFFFTYPSLFDFRVVTNGITLLHRKKLAITDLNLDLSSDGQLTWHADGFPTSLHLTISFKESEIPVRENLANITLFGQKLGRV